MYKSSASDSLFFDKNVSMTDEVPTEGKVQVLGELSILLYMGVWETWAGKWRKQDCDL